jgi:hypothetical protein
MTNGKMAGKVIVRRQVYFNERSFPARKLTPKNQMSQPENRTTVQAWLDLPLLMMANPSE